MDSKRLRAEDGLAITQDGFDARIISFVARDAISHGTTHRHHRAVREAISAVALAGKSIQLDRIKRGILVPVLPRAFVSRRLAWVRGVAGAHECREELFQECTEGCH